MKEFNEFKKLIFMDTDKICYGDKFATRVSEQPSFPVAEFFCINPLSDTTDYQKQANGSIVPVASSGRRADMNVTRFQNFLFEMDGTQLATQLQYLKDCKFPWASITWSGGKSYHAILSLEVPLDVKPHTQQGIDFYKKIWKQLAHVLCQRIQQPISILDSSTQNPSRLSRMPFAMRTTGSAGDSSLRQVVQSLKLIGTLCTEQQFAELLMEAPDMKLPVNMPKANLDITDGAKFRFLMPLPLKANLEFPASWAQGEAGNYPHLFRLTCWAIDSTGVPKNILLEFMERHTFPALRRMGYPTERMYKPVEDAYIKKGIS